MSINRRSFAAAALALLAARFALYAELKA